MIRKHTCNIAGVDGTPYPDRTDIAVTLVWDSLAHDYAQEIVSFLTC